MTTEACCQIVYFVISRVDVSATSKKSTETIESVSDGGAKGKSTAGPSTVASSKGDTSKGDTSKVGAGTGNAPVGKKTLGQKEIIPFEWKLIGESSGCFLTLFKAIELDEVEAQMERVRREGYYKNLKILSNTDKIVQSKTGLKVKLAATDSKKEAKSLKTAKFSKASNKVSIIKISMKPSIKKKLMEAEKKAKKAKKAKKVAKKKTTAKKAAKVKKTTTKKKAVKKKATKAKAAPKTAPANKTKTAKKTKVVKKTKSEKNAKVKKKAAPKKKKK